MDAQPNEHHGGAEAIKKLTDALYEHAERAIPRRPLLRQDDRNDIAHEAFAEIWESLGSFALTGRVIEQASRAVNRVADRLQKRRERRAKRNKEVEWSKRRGREGKPHEAAIAPLRAPSRQQVGVPTLCGRLTALGKRSPFEKEIARLVTEAAAVVVATPTAFSAAEIALFTLAWRRGQSAAEIVGTAGTRTARAVTERLKRIANRIENSIADHLVAVLPAESGQRLAEALASKPARKQIENVATQAVAAVCEDVTLALGALIHRNSS